MSRNSENSETAVVIDEKFCNENAKLMGVRIKDLFNSFDQDNNGFITLDELKLGINLLCKNNKISEQKAMRIFKKADSNHDDRIDRNEFRALIKDPIFQKSFKNYLNTFVPKHEHKDEYSICPPPVGILIITVIQLIFFVIDIKQTNKEEAVSYYLSFNPTKKAEFWRFITYIFVHADWVHLTGNLIFQTALGFPVELHHNSWRILAIYLSGALAGSLATSIFEPTVNLVGASAGVYAIATSYIATVIINYAETPRAITQLLIVGVFIMADYFNAIYQMRQAQHDYQIGYVSHLAGGGIGVIAGTFILRNFKVRKYEQTIQYAAMIVFCSLIFVSIVLNIIYNN